MTTLRPEFDGRQRTYPLIIFYPFAKYPLYKPEPPICASINGELTEDPFDLMWAQQVAKLMVGSQCGTANGHGEYFAESYPFFGFITRGRTRIHLE